MILISKREKEKLVEKGCKFHDDICRTYTKHPKYFLKETEYNLRKLEEIRRN